MKDTTLPLKDSIAKARQLLDSGQFERARELGDALRKSHPTEPNSGFVLARAWQGLGLHGQAADLLLDIVRATPNFGLAYVHRAECLAALAQPQQARECLEQGMALLPSYAEGWRKLAELCLAVNDQVGWQTAMGQYGELSGQSPALLAAARAFQQDDLAAAEYQVRDYLGQQPNDVSALRLLAEIGIRHGVYDDAEQILDRVLALAPDFHLARLNYAHVLARRERCELALEQLQRVERHQPQLPALHIERAAVLTRLGRFDEAIALYDEMIARMPGLVKLYNSRGHALKTVGRRAEAEQSYERATQIEPADGEAWWSLADLKNYRFSAEQRRKMLEQCQADRAPRDLAQIEFALGKALEDEACTVDAFVHYQRGNHIKRRLEAWRAEDHSRQTDHMIAATPAAIFQQPGGCTDPAPIFIVGLPRAGSTLLEQILSSHSQVEGTKELADMTALARQLSAKRDRADSSQYPAKLASLSAQECCDIGEDYLQRTRIQRSGLPFFIDKMPNNFFHIGLIKRILPKAKIIDARRHPLACCFSAFKQHFANGQTFSYDLEDLGRYYRDYVRLMDHWHAVLPRQLITVHYEAVVSDFEQQVRGLLDYCELPFEASCLSFYQTQRAVRTASSEQVRQPIYQSGLQAWKPFELQLQPLKLALADTLTRYPYQ